jgi:hypothetical protein
MAAGKASLPLNPAAVAQLASDTVLVTVRTSVETPSPALLLAVSAIE